MTSDSSRANPYVGPRTFSVEERDLFFGREREARDLLARVLSERLLLFYAQSGAGKSSLLNTRLIPQLEEERGFVVLPVGRVSGELPAGVAGVEDIYAFNLLLSIDAGGDPARLAHVTLEDFLGRLGRRTVVDASGGARKAWVYDPARPPGPAAQSPGARRYALIVDQFEEIMTAHPARWAEREDFFRQLDCAMEAYPNLWVVLTLREDFVAGLDPYAPLLADRLRARFYMERMSLDAALEAIKQPAARFNRPFAPGVAETLAGDLAQVRVPGRRETITGQYVEPVQLQVVCYQLWENIQDRAAATVSADDLHEAGDVNRALIQFYEDTLKAVLAEPAVQRAGVGERQLRTWFDKKLITDEGTRDLVRQGEDETGGLPNAPVGALQRRFLVRADTRGSDTRIELVHDRFVEPIRASNRAWLARNLNPLTEAAHAWRVAGRDPALLYAGSQLTAAAAQLAARPDEFGDLEQEFLAQSQQAEARRAARRQRLITWGAVLLALVFIALAGWALWSRGQAAAAAADAQVSYARLVVSEAKAQREAETAIAAERTAEAASTRAFVEQAAANAASTAAVAGHATAQAANTALVRELNARLAELAPTVTAQATALPPATTPAPPPRRTPTSTPTVPGIRAPVPRFAQVPTLSVQQLELERVQNQLTALAPAPIITRTPTPRLAASRPPGHIVFVSDRGSAQDLYGLDPNDPQNGWRDRLTYASAWEPGYSPAADLLAFTRPRAAGTPSTIYTRPFQGGAERPITEFWDYWEPSFSPDGSRLAVTSSRDNRDWEIYIIDLNGKVLQQLTNEDPARSWAPDWSPDGGRMLYASERGVGRGKAEIWVVDLSTGQRRQLTHIGGFNTDPDWSPDGKQIAFISDRDGNPDVWVMDADGGNSQNLTNSPEPEKYPAWSADGAWLAFTRLVPNQEIFLMRADGSRVRNLTNNLSEDWQPIWVP